MPEPKTTQPAPPQGELSKAYKPSEHEDRIRARWDAARAFHADPSRVVPGAPPDPSPNATARPPYAIVIPPPNVTAALHLGHALNNTLQDVLARAHRMMGFETLWMPGTDHAGIATQTVVEKRLIASEGRKRTEYKRDEFVEKVQAFKDEYEAVITGQLKAMGCSCDWERQRFTMDEICAKAVREAFFRLFRDGLIYRGKRLVNWDPATQTVLADDEVENEEVDGNFYYLRYPLCDAEGRDVKVKLGDGEPVDHITVATTRPETFLGDTAVAVNPRDPRWPTLRESNAHVRLPFVGRVIPIVADDYVVMPAAMQSDPDEAKKDPKAAFATGFLKVTPAHDTNDYALWQRHKDEMPGGLINVMAPDARGRAAGDRQGVQGGGAVREREALSPQRGALVPQPRGDRAVPERPVVHRGEAADPEHARRGAHRGDGRARALDGGAGAQAAARRQTQVRARALREDVPDVAGEPARLADLAAVVVGAQDHCLESPLRGDFSGSDRRHRSVAR